MMLTDQRRHGLKYSAAQKVANFRQRRLQVLEISIMPLNLPENEVIIIHKQGQVECRAHTAVIAQNFQGSLPPWY